MIAHTYTVNKIVQVHDGDTLTAEIDLGFSVSVTEILRLYGINAPELRGDTHDAAVKSRDYVINRLNEAKKIEILTFRVDGYKTKHGKYGRYLAEVYVDDVMLNQELLDKGLAVPYMGHLVPKTEVDDG